MSDIICARCGEPWDSTGGIHHTHSDLTEKQYTLLLEGRGCPGCCGTPQYFVDVDHMCEEEITEEMQADWLQKWRRSVERLSEGEGDYLYETFEKEPLPPLEDPFEYEAD